MAQFQFTIPADSIASGDPASDVEVVVDKGFQRSAKHNVLTAKFGDGYEQRVGDGINTKKDEFNISLANRSADDINEVAAFFDAYAGKSFSFTVTNHSGDEEMKVICENYSISYITELYHSLNAKFRRVYEP